MSTARYALAAALVAVLLLAPSGSAGGVGKKPEADERVLVKDNFFSPRSLSITEGDTVKWAWRGDNQHNVTFTKIPQGASKRGGRTRRHGRWLRTFHVPGQYRYVCTLFAGMRGTLKVEPEAAPSRPAPVSR